MTQVLSDKKNFYKKSKIIDFQGFNLFFQDWKNLFKVYRRDNSSVAISYILGLMKCEKNHTNIERMVEENPEQAYHQYHNFLCESKWDYVAVNNKTALETSALMLRCKEKSNKPTGFIIDESSHLKKGTESVAVARQYAGVSGKVDNCQVAVYGSLCNEENTTIIDTRLFLPQKWVEDKDRYSKRRKNFSDKASKSTRNDKICCEIGCEI
jgi:SRSO17 transposase